MDGFNRLRGVKTYVICATVDPSQQYAEALKKRTGDLVIVCLATGKCVRSFKVALALNIKFSNLTAQSDGRS